MKKVAVIQSNYIPWKGYFDIINDVDLFIFHDDLQYTKDDWRNRNKIITPNGLRWLTIPVGRDEHRLICEVKILSDDWQKKHYSLIATNYAKALNYSYLEDFLKEIYLKNTWHNLSELNQYIIKTISRNFLGIDTEFRDSREYHTRGAKQENLLSLLIDCGAETYISGPAAKNYIDEKKFENARINIIWKDYNNYPEYKQLHDKFYHNVSIIDMLLNLGEKTADYIWGQRTNLHKIFDMNIFSNFQKINKFTSITVSTFKGFRTIENSINCGIQFIGTTVHDLNEKMAAGKILVQSVIPIEESANLSQVHNQMFRALCLVLLNAKKYLRPPEMSFPAKLKYRG